MNHATKPLLCVAIPLTASAFTDDKDYADGPGYLFQASFTRSYLKSSLSVEAVLACEVQLAPKK